MLKPFYMLKGKIVLVKETKLSDGYIERQYRDDDGNKAVVGMKDLKDKKV